MGSWFYLNQYFKERAERLIEEQEKLRALNGGVVGGRSIGERRIVFIFGLRFVPFGSTLRHAAQGLMTCES